MGIFTWLFGRKDASNSGDQSARDKVAPVQGATSIDCRTNTHSMEQLKDDILRVVRQVPRENPNNVISEATTRIRQLGTPDNVNQALAELMSDPQVGTLDQYVLQGVSIGMKLGW